MPKYVLSLLVKPKLKNLLSVLRYRLDFFMKCANVAFSVVPRISAGDAEN